MPLSLSKFLNFRNPLMHKLVFLSHILQCMLSLCSHNPQIKFVAEFESDAYDMLVCTDVR